jgi:hydroxymethylpyrimidine pyrophosphatase-like HAD family hydrolase
VAIRHYPRPLSKELKGLFFWNAPDILSTSMVTFNPSIKLILADVDETIADVYTKATPEMIHELNLLIEEGRVLFMVTGAGLQSVRERIIDLLKPEVRQRVLIAHCSGAEVWGFQPGGEINSEPYYGLYEGHFTEEQKKTWREITNQLIEMFHLETYPPQPKAAFKQISQGNPLSIMLADRGPQITFEFNNSTHLSPEQKDVLEKKIGIEIPLHHDTYDLRYPVMEEAIKLYKQANLPIHPHFGGMFALDHIINGVSKTKAVKYVLWESDILADMGILREDINHISEIEIWGDKFSQKKGGPDFQMCQAVLPGVRAIDFRRENAEELPEGYNIQIWDGQKYLHEGLLEYLQSRQSQA